MWEALKYVSSGFTLCAFIVATVVFYLNHRIKEERKRIEAAPAEDRASLVAKTLEVFHVDTAGLSRQQQFDIAMRQINGRIERFRIIATLVVVLALVAAGLSAYAIALEKKPQEQGAEKSLDSDFDPNHIIPWPDQILGASKAFDFKALDIQIMFITREQSTSLQLPPGAMVFRVANGPAASAGFHAGDVIIEINGTKIATEDDLRQTIRKLGPSKISFKLRRGNDVRSVVVDCPNC